MNNILRYISLILIACGIASLFLLTIYNIADKRVKPIEKEIQKIREYLESHNHRLNKLERPELVNELPKND